MAVRRLFSLVIFGIGISSGAVAAPTPDYGAAYKEALMCWRATLDARHTWPAKSAWFEDSSKISFDALIKIGRLLGYDNARLNADMDTPAETMDELKMVRDPGLLAQKIGECQSLGLALR